MNIPISDQHQFKTCNFLLVPITRSSTHSSYYSEANMSIKSIMDLEDQEASDQFMLAADMLLICWIFIDDWLQLPSEQINMKVNKKSPLLKLLIYKTWNRSFMHTTCWTTQSLTGLGTRRTYLIMMDSASGPELMTALWFPFLLI